MTEITGSAGRRVLLSSVSSDAHTWNLVYLQLLMEENGFDVTMLGACVPDDLLVSACLDEAPAAVVLSSVNGHGFADGVRMVKRLREDPRLTSVPVAIGGKLGIVGGLAEDQVRSLREAGVDVVFADDAPPEQLVRWLEGVAVCLDEQGADAV